MKLIFLGLSAVAFVSLSHAAEVPSLANDEAYLTISSVKSELIDDTDPGVCQSDTAPGLPDEATLVSPQFALSEIGVIVNIGKTLWEIVVKNQPVVNVSSVSANAIPSGVTDWRRLQGWRAPRSLTYRMSYQNTYGMTVIDFSYRLLFTYGGNVNGRGQYLSNVSVVPADLSVLWGYKFSASASVPNITNAGTARDPIAAAEILMTWKIDTVLQHRESSSSYYVRGDGKFQEL